VDPARPASEPNGQNPWSRYSDRPWPLPHEDSDNAESSSGHHCCPATRPMPIVDLPKCSLWQMGGLLGGAATTWTLPALRRPRLPGPDRQPACRGATVWSARRLHIEPTMLAYLNGTATPTAVLGEDLSGSIPVGSALNTHGLPRVIALARYTRKIPPIRDVPEGASSNEKQTTTHLKQRSPLFAGCCLLPCHFFYSQLDERIPSRP
jgi:hypothetical protein